MENILKNFFLERGTFFFLYKEGNSDKAKEENNDSS